MSHHLSNILDEWLPTYQQDWVLAIITRVQGSSYRKPGAMMLFHPMGKSIGMLSGGCLEADLRRHAQKVIQTQQISYITYDATDESDTSYQLGCGGIVDILMVSLTKANQYLGLLTLHDALNQGHSCHYQLSLPKTGSLCDVLQAKVECHQQHNQAAHFNEKSTIATVDDTSSTSSDEAILIVPVRAPIHIGIFGGGLDAVPVCQLAQQLGWRVSVFDERSAYARQYDFQGALIYKQEIEHINTRVLSELHGAFVMSHNIQMDARALAVLANYPVQYISLLGPGHRRDKVLGIAQIKAEDFSGYFSAPAGLALGGELPSSIALSMLSQCHAVLHQSSGVRLDAVMQ